MAEYYGGAPNAFAGGMEFGAARRARQIRENALNALIAQYGPEAGDPQAALQMQTLQQREQMHPLDMAEARRIEAARAAMVQQHGAVAGDPAAQQRNTELEDRDRALQTQAAQRAAAVLKKVKENKGDLGAAFDFIQGVLPAIGIPVEHLAEAREAILTDPDSVDELVALLQGLPDQSKRGAMGSPVAVYDKVTGEKKMIIPMADGSIREIPNMAAAETVLGERRAATAEGNLGQRSRSLSIKEAENAGFKAPPGFQIWQTEDGVIHAAPQSGSLQEQESEKNAREADTLDEKFLRAAAGIADHGEVVLTGAAKASEYFNGAPDGVLMQNLRRLAPIIAGIDAHDAWQAIKEIQNNVSIDELQRMRQSSPTGGAMGAVSDRDIELLQGALGRLDVIRDPKEMVATLARISTTYNRIIAAAQQDAAAAQQRMQNRPRRQAPPAPGVREPEPDSIDALLNKYPPRGRQ